MIFLRIKAWLQWRKELRQWREIVIDAMRDGMTKDQAESFAYHVEYQRDKQARKRLEERYFPKENER